MAWRICKLVMLAVVAVLAAGGGQAWARSPWRVARIAGSEGAGRVSEEPPALAVAPDGWAVLAWDGRHHKFVAVRPPGASRFGVARRFARGGAAPLAAAIDGRGQAVIAWVSADGDAVRAARVSVGGVGPAVRLSPLGANLEEGAPQVVLGPGGRAAVVWFMFQPAGAYVNLAPPGHGFGAPELMNVGSSVAHQGGRVSVFDGGLYTGFDSLGRLHVTWQETEGSLRGEVWSRAAVRGPARTLLPLATHDAETPPEALDIATLSSGAQLAIFGEEAGGVWLSRQAPGGIFGPLLAQSAIRGVSDAASAADGRVLLALGDDRLAVRKPGGRSFKPEASAQRGELRTLAIGVDGRYLAAWEATRGGRESGRLLVALGDDARLGRTTLITKENLDERISSAVTADGEALLAFETPHGVEVATRHGG